MIRALCVASLLFATAVSAAPLSNADVRTRALQVLGKWVSTQNSADAVGYLGLYDAAHFRGRKRTPRGTTDFEWKGWAADRSALLKSHPTIAVEGTTVESWLDPGSTLLLGVVRMRFLQRWKSARYADHGIKVLDLAFDPPTSELLIRREELLNSAPGFDDAPTSTANPLTVTTANAAGTALANLKLTAGDVDAKLAAISDRTTRKLLAGVILDGDLKCDKTIEENECGQEIIEWAPLEPSLAWPDPCVRRYAALWAIGQLDANELKSILEKLLPLFLLAKPERELPAAILARARSGDDALRLRVLRAAVEGGHKDLAEAAVEGLGMRARAVAATELHLDSAAAQLDPQLDRATLLRAVTDQRLAVATRAALTQKIGTLPAAEAAAALRKVADDDTDCGVSVYAAMLLWTHGDARHLPKRPELPVAATEMGRELCRLTYDPDVGRAQARWLEFLPPHGFVTVETEDGNDTRKATLSRKDSTLLDLPAELRRGSLTCDHDSCEVETSEGSSSEKVTIVFSGGYVRAINKVVTHWDCGC